MELSAIHDQSESSIGPLDFTHQLKHVDNVGARHLKQSPERPDRLFAHRQRLRYCAVHGFCHVDSGSRMIGRSFFIITAAL